MKSDDIIDHLIVLSIQNNKCEQQTADMIQDRDIKRHKGFF